jgi:hypothetical protein
MSILADVGGDFPPFVLWNAETGELSYRPFDEAAGERLSKVIELGSSAAKFALDTMTVVRGFGKVRQGARDFVMTPAGSAPPGRPDADYKPAIGITLWNPPLGELRIETTATIFRGEIGAVVDRCADFDEARKGLIPVILFADRRDRPFRALGKTFYGPVIHITNWAERDAIPAFRARPPTVPPPTALPSLDDNPKLGFTRDDKPRRKP